MYPRRIPGSDVNLGLAAAFVASLVLLLVFTDPAASPTSEWQEARPAVEVQKAVVDECSPAVEVGVYEVNEGIGVVSWAGSVDQSWAGSRAQSPSVPSRSRT